MAAGTSSEAPRYASLAHTAHVHDLLTALLAMQDFVEGAYNALEDDHNCSPYFKIYFNGKGTITT
jgi:hypothetical protein